MTHLPFATPEELTLPGTRGYRVMEESLSARLAAAQGRVDALASRPGVDAQRLREEAEAELDAAHRAIDDYEAEQRELDEERAADCHLTIAQELR